LTSSPSLISPPPLLFFTSYSLEPPIP
jgi:hypothetical protein